MAQAYNRAEQKWQFARYGFLLASIWTLIVVSLALIALNRTLESAREAALIEASTAFNKDLLYRQWVTIQGGVYVPITEYTPPNSFLTVPQRDITVAGSGQELTLVNPAYMTRQVYELANDVLGVQVHITSLNPVNVFNTPDEWERGILEAFELGMTEISSIESVNGEDAMRYMRVMITEEGCLLCHGDYGYEVGDIRGGISVSVPMQPYYETTRKTGYSIVFSHLVLWVLGLSGIGFSTLQISNSVGREREILNSLRQSDRRFRSAVDASLDAFYLMDSIRNIRGEIIDFLIVEVNDIACQQIGLTQEQLIGHRVGDLLPEFQSNGFFEKYKTVVSTGIPCEEDVETAIYTHPGWYHHQIVKVGNSVAIMNRDITERKQAQQHEFNLALEIERRQILTSFIQDTAHEFRTPLSIISSSTYLMLHTDDEYRQQQKGEQIKYQVQYITKLVDMLLMMAKLESISTLTMIRMNARQMLIDIHQKTYDRSNGLHTIQAFLPSNLPEITGDKEYLTIAINHIVENACRFTPDDGTISIRAGTGDKMLWIEIEDSGCGILPENLPHIFKTFWRSDSAHTTHGFGLGLSIAQHIIEKHGGKIAVESVLDEGSTFRVILPLNLSPTYI